MIDSFPVSAILAGDIIRNGALVMSGFESLFQLGKEIRFLLDFPDRLALRLNYLFLHPYDNPLLVRFL